MDNQEEYCCGCGRYLYVSFTVEEGQCCKKCKNELYDEPDRNEYYWNGKNVSKKDYIKLMNMS
jgi:chromosome segregation ATPase